MIRKIICLTDGVEYLLHDPRDLSGEVKCSEPVLTLEMGKAGSLTFTIAPTHPYKYKIKPLVSIIKVVEEGKEKPLFVGRSIGDSYDFYNSGSVTCEGELGYLNDSIQRPFSHEYDDGPFLQDLIKVHNSQVEDSKKFTYGTSTLNSGSYERKLDSAATTMSTIKSLLTDNGNGYLHVRYDGSTRYLDYVTTYGPDNTQVVRFGENLLDLTKSTDPTQIITALIPYGANDNDGNAITISSVNNGSDYLVDSAAVEKYGYIWGTETFSDATEPGQLLKKAQAYMESTSVLSTVIEATAVDMNMVSDDMESFKLGCYTRVISTPHNVDTKMLLTKKVLNLNSPEKDTFTFGGELQSFVGTTNKNQLAVGLKVQAISGNLQKDIDRKIDNATQLITGGMGGYVYTHTDADGHPDEIMFLDTNNYKTAKNVLRINKNGIGFSTTGYTGPFKNAWTIDGNLVASYITAGSMLADRIRGGTFIVGGQGTGADGSISVQRSDGSVIGYFDKNGITLGGFNVDGGGNLTTDKNVSVQFGNTCYINKDEIMIGEWTLYDGYMEGTWLESDDHAQYWDSNGELHATEIYIHQPWWSKGTDHRWSVTEAVESIWDDVKALKQYVYNGGWCKNDGGGDTCTGTHSCTCVSGYDVCSHCDGSDDLECDCEAGCDKADTSGSCSCDDKTTCSDCPSHCSKAICVKGG